MLMLALFSCTKQQTIVAQKDDETGLPAPPAINPGGTAGYCVADQENAYGYDSVLTPTILGAKLNGYPYSVSVMQQAYLQVLGSSSGIGVNAWYMRFKPADADQLAALEDNDIDLFDYPLDYELTQEGDYYNDGTGTPETIPWLYAVVNKNFVAPAGVVSELLQQIHVPADYRVEKKAFELTNNYVDDDACYVTNNANPCPDPCYSQCPDYDPSLCGGSGGGGGTPPPSPIRIPSGVIQVWDDVINPNNYVAVQKARVVAKRFLKVERTFTNTAGQYQFTKSFRNKVKLIVKFKNEDALIKGLRGFRTWQINFPVKINMGTYRGNLNNITYNINDNNSPTTRGAKHWAAATAHNNVQEYRDYALAEFIGVPPQKMKILLVNYGFVTGSTPMYAKRLESTIGTTFINTLVLGFSPWPAAGGINALAAILKAKVDMIVSYNRNGDTRNSAQMAELLYHELTHAAHCQKAGNVWYKQLVVGEFNESFLGFLTPGERPYGTATGFYAGYIGLAESWAGYIGHTFTNSKYGNNSPQFNEQGNGYTLDNPVFGLSSNLNLLEDFSPLRTNDPFRWIPQGLFYDLFDIRNETGNPIIDNVSNYTNQQLFDAIDSDIITMQEYRQRLIQENNNNQSAQVTNLFAQYNY